MDAVTFKGGLPYGPDVNRLKEAFPVERLTEDTVITHEKLEAVVSESRGSQRYYGVINSWISQLKNSNGLFIIWEASIGIKVLNPAEILNVAEVRTRQKIKQTGKAIKTFGWVDRSRLDTTGQKRLDHQLRVVAAVKESIDNARKQLSIDIAPVKSLPKPQLLRQA